MPSNINKKREAGVAIIEFVLMFPLILAVLWGIHFLTERTLKQQQRLEQKERLYWKQNENKF